MFFVASLLVTQAQEVVEEKTFSEIVTEASELNTNEVVDNIFINLGKTPTENVYEYARKANEYRVSVGNQVLRNLELTAVARNLVENLSLDNERIIFINKIESYVIEELEPKIEDILSSDEFIKRSVINEFNLYKSLWVRITQRGRFIDMKTRLEETSKSSLEVMALIRETFTSLQ